MKLYLSPFAPNPMRVQIVALEKGVELETVDVTTLPPGEYAKINPLRQVPALELDDKRVITESLTICQYLDEISGPPRLYGATADDRARIGMWDRRSETLLFNAAVEYGHHSHPMFRPFLTQHPEWAKTLVPRAEQMMSLIGDQLERERFIAGDEISAADFTAVLGYGALTAWGAIARSERTSIVNWSDAMLARPSMAPWRQTLAAFQASPQASKGMTGGRNGDAS